MATSSLPDIDKAWNFRDPAASEAELSDDEPRLRARFLLERGRVLNSSGHAEDAIAPFERDIAFRKAQSQRFEASIATWSRAVTLRYLGRAEEALAVQQSLVDHPDRQGNAAEGYTHEEIGECLLLLGRDAEAKPHFAIAHERLGDDEWIQANEPARLARLKQLAESSP